MDSASKTLYDAFKDVILKELGQLDPNWFEVLTAQTSPNERIVPDKDELCANQEGNFKTPSEKMAVDSQLFSTPKVFRQIGPVSPETEDERSFTAAQEKPPIPWTATQSPCLFRMSGQGALGEKSEDVEPHSGDSLDLISTPNKSSVKYAKHISESLGAQINPDISWTSSLNTPPAVPSTLILSKTDESLCPLSITADGNFVFVRKLFPSLSKASSVDVPENKATHSVSQGAVAFETKNCLQSSFNQTEGVGQQKRPDDVEDKEVCVKVEENLDAAETDSNFFANSSSALRKVKPERIKCKQIVQANEKKCSSKDVTRLQSSSTEETTADLKSGRLPSTPLSKTGDPAISQWSPLNLSQLPSCALESSILTKEDDTESVQLFRPSVNITDFGFIKQKKKFVYTIPSLKTQVQGKANQPQKMDSPFEVSDCGQELNVKPLENDPGESKGCNTLKNTIQNQRKITGENGGAKLQDFDMSQLCKECAQDFSQAVIFGQKEKVAKDSLNNCSPSTCVSATKQEKQTAKQADLLHERDSINTKRQTCSISPGTVSDSGMHSGDEDITRTTYSLENAGSSRWCVNMSFPFTKEEIWKEHIEAENKTTLQKFVERETFDPGQPNRTEVVQKSDCIPLSSQICDSLAKKTNVPLSSAYSSGFRTASDKGIHISSASLKRAKCLFEETEGEKMFINQLTKFDYSAKSKISLSNGPLSNKTSTSNQVSHLEETLGNISSQLTASEKADVTALCSLLEEADSQFDSTQSKTAKLIQQDQDDASLSQKPDRELDPDFLAGINFDDSFNSDGGKSSSNTVVRDKMALVSDRSTSQSSDLSSLTALKNETSVAPFLENISEDNSHLTLTEPNHFHTTEHDEPSKLNNCNPLMLDVAFTTAGGNMLRVSKPCLSKARTLFADLEKNLTDQQPLGKQNAKIDAKTDKNCIMDMCKKVLKFTSKGKCHVENIQDGFSKTEQSVYPYKQFPTAEDDCIKSFKNNKTDTKVLQSDFHMASGKEISIPTKCMQPADAFFKDCNIMGHKDDSSHKKDKHVPAKSTESKSFSKYKNPKVNASEEHIAECTKSEKVNAGLITLHTKGPHVHGVDISSNGSLAFKDAKSFHGNPFTSSVPFSTPPTSNIGLSAFDGFCTASGKKVFVSADAVRRAECLLNQINTHEDVNVQLNPKTTCTKTTGDCRDEDLNAENMEFQTTQGKEVAILSAAQKKTKGLIKECESIKDAASGEAVVVSSEDLQKTKMICTDVGLSKSIPTVFNIRHDENHNDAQDKTEKRHCGFTTAGGAKVHVSQKNLLKAKDLFKDFDDLDLTKAMQEADAFFDCDVDDYESVFPEGKKEDVDVSEDAKSKKENRVKLYPDQSIAVNHLQEPKIRCAVDTSKQGKQKKETLPQQNSGFQTASGKRVDISSEALKKAKTLLSDCERVENKVNATLPQSEVSILPCRNSSFICGNGKPVTLSPEALQKAPSLFSDIGMSAEIPDISRTTKSDKNQTSGNNTGKLICGFTTAGGAKVHVSEKNLLKAKRLFEGCDNSTKTSLDSDFSFKKEDCIVSSNSKILTEHKSKAVCSEGDRLNKNVFKLQSVTSNVSDEPENGFTKDIKEQVKQKEGISLQQKSGFQTASGKLVAVSFEALTRAKVLLNENEAKENMHVSLPSSKIPVTETFPLKSGFSSASGKPVTFSSEAFQKAKALFSDTSLSTNNSTHPDTKRSDEKRDDQSKAEYIHCGFMTAGGAQVHVSEKSLLEAKHFLTEFADGDHSSLSNPTSPQNPMKLELPKAKSVERSNNLTSVSDENMHKRRDPYERSFSTTTGVDDLKDIVKDSNMLDYNLNQKSYSKTAEVQRTEESSDLNLQLLNLTGCTETQHKFLAQEALDCTKALLEDEVLAGQKFLVTSEETTQTDDSKSSSRLTEDENRKKRLLKDTDLTVHPPKRRLLDELDRTVDSSKDSVLHPVKSCPNGLIKDRGVFKYSASLHPNITNPHSASKHYKDTRFQKTTLQQASASGDGRASHPKMLFVPPFIKNAKRELPKNPDPKENPRTPVFVPPFKKQRTVLQKSFSKQQEQDKRQLTSTVEPTSNKYVPPAIKTQSTTDVTASVDTRNQNVLNVASVPVNCEVMSSEAEASVVDDSFSNDQDELQNIELARDMQDMRIRKKKRQTIRPLPGSLFLTKTCGVARISLKSAVNGKRPASYNPEQLYQCGVQKNVFEITSETAESFRFNLLQFVKRETFKGGNGVHLADGGWLIPSNDWTAGKEEFYRALCDTPGVDPKLISEAWVYNHYRWIVWKQASMEKSFPETMGSLCLTPEQVLLQLKYRYDVEVDHSRRPALRKIMEKDDAAAKTLVLCVCEIISRGHAPNRPSHNDKKPPQSADAKMETSCAVVRLTDGWYAVRAQLDEPLTAMLHRGLLTVGVKLVIHGAQLIGSQDACSPLEAPDSLVLKICANSCRRARWDAKLGFYGDPRPFLLPLSSLFSNGGPIGCVDIVILRSYPIQWMERKADGGIVFRSSRAEEKEARRFNNLKQTAMETLFAKIQAEIEKEEKGNSKLQRRRQSSHQDVSNLQDGDELYEAVGDDPADLEAKLSEEQLKTLHAYKRSLLEKKQAELQDRCRRALEAEDDKLSCPKRDVTPVWRLYIADSKTESNRVYQLNLWRPSSDLQSLLKEGCRYKVYNLVSSGGQKRSGIETVQLTGTKKTQFQDLQVSQEWLSDCFQPRVSTDFVNLQNAEFQPLCGEVDLTGCVISVIDEHGASPGFYLADGKLNFVKVRCFSGLSQAGLEDVIKPRVLLALSNLQLRGQSLHPTPVVYAGDLTVFSTNPKDVHLQESFSQLKNLLQCQNNFYQVAEEKLSLLVKSDGTRFIYSPSLQPKTSASETARKQDSKTIVTFQKADQNLGSCTPVGRNPPAGTSSSGKDPKNLKRRKALDYLSRIPSPPPLSHLASAASPCVNKTFNPPRRSGPPSTFKSAKAPVQKPTDSLVEDGWVNDEELAMIDTQVLRVGDLL